MKTDFTAYLKSGGIAFVFRSLGAITSFFLTFIVARSLSPKEAGVFFLFLSLLSILAVISRLGFGPVITRIVAESYDKSNWGTINGIIGKSLLIVVGTSFLITLFFYLSGQIIAEKVFNEPLMVFPLKYGFITLIPFSCLWLVSHANQGLHRINRMLVYNNLGITTLTIIFIALSSTLINNNENPLSIDTVVASYSVSCLTLLIIALLDWYKTKVSSTFSLSYATKRLLLLGLPLYIMAILGVLLQSISQQLLGIWHDSEQVAIFTVSFRIAALMSLALTAFNAISAPRFAAAYGIGDTEKLRSDAAAMNAVLIAVSFPALIVIMLIPDIILSLFGNSYIDHPNVLRVLALAQLIVVLSGSVGSILTMTGKANYNAKSSAAALLLLILSAIFLIPEYAALGAAVSFFDRRFVSNSSKYICSQTRIWLYSITRCHELKKTATKTNPSLKVWLYKAPH